MTTHLAPDLWTYDQDPSEEVIKSLAGAMEIHLELIPIGAYAEMSNADKMLSVMTFHFQLVGTEKKVDAGEVERWVRTAPEEWKANLRKCFTEVLKKIDRWEEK